MPISLKSGIGEFRYLTCLLQKAVKKTWLILL